MAARTRYATWIAAPLMAGCAASPAIDLTPITPQPESAGQLARRSEAKLALGRNYLSAGEEKLGRFLLEQAEVDSRLAGLRAGTARLRASARLAR